MRRGQQFTGPTTSCCASYEADNLPPQQQEKDRMDIYHTLFLVARNKKLHDAPIAEPITIETRILDVGTGTGIWAIDMAELVPLPAFQGTIG